MLEWAIPALRFGSATTFAVVVLIVVANLGLARSIDDGVIALGFDSQRAQLIAYALVALVGSAVVGALLRKRAPAWLGGLLYYVFGYLLPFIGQAQHPVAGPDGVPQMLLPGAFVATIATLLAIGGLVSGMGAVLGEAAGHLLIAPLVALGRDTLSRIAAIAGIGPRGEAISSPRMARVLLAKFALGIVLMAAGALVASNLGSILYYGTTAAIYQPAGYVAQVGTVQHATYPSPALGGRTRQFMIYLPPSYATSPQQRYPVVYLLHGSPGQVADWFDGAHANATANVLIAADKIRQVILVAPDGNGPVHPVSEWANSSDGRQRMEDSIAIDLVRYIDAHYRTLADPAHRAIGGLSEGGYAAVNIALHHPTVFGTALSLSGFFNATGRSIFGSGTTNAAYRRYNSPDVYLTTSRGILAARSLSFVLGVGMQDYQYRPLALAFYRELRHYGARVELLQQPGGHSWQLWAAQFAQALPLMEPPTALVAGHRRSSG